MGEAVWEVALSRLSVSGTRRTRLLTAAIKVPDTGQKLGVGERLTVRLSVTAIIQSVMSVNIAMKNDLCLAAIFAVSRLSSSIRVYIQFVASRVCCSHRFAKSRGRNCVKRYGSR